MVIFEVKSTFLFPLDQAIPRGFLLCSTFEVLCFPTTLIFFFFALPLWLSISQPFIKDQRNCSECCCALYFYYFFCYKYFLFIYFTTLLLFRCVLLFSLFHMYKHYFFLLFYLLHFSVARQNSSHHYFFLQALHYFSLNIIYKFAFNTHTLPLQWHTHKIKSSFSPSLRLPNSTQKLRSCYAISARFKVHYTHTHTWSSWSSPFCLGFTPIAAPSRPLLGNFSSFAILATTTANSLSLPTAMVVVEPWALPLSPLFCFHLYRFREG